MNPTEAQEKLIQDLRKLRVEQGLTQTEVGKRSGMAQSAVCRLEANGAANFTLSTLHRYASAVGVTVTFNIEAGTDHP